MSEEIRVLLPKLGESIHSATIVQWFKKIGDPVNLDEPLLEVSTDKVNSEIPSPVAGILKEIHANPDQELQVGALIAVIGLGAHAAQREAPRAHAPLAVQAGASEATEEMKNFFSPALLRIARENGIPLEQLGNIPGSGMGGRLTKNDLEEFIEKRAAAPKPCPSRPKRSSPPSRPVPLPMSSGSK